jgi:threonine synthase
VANGIQAAGEPMLVRPDMACLLSAFAQRSITP